MALVLVPVLPADAVNPCASRAQIRYDVDDVRYQDPSLGCVYMAVNFQYQPPTSGTYYSTTVRHNLVQGTYYDTPNKPQITKARACTGAYCNNYGLYSSWWTTSSWYAFG